MSCAASILRGAKAPNLSIKTTDGDHWQLSDQKPESFTLLMFYRGLHCPICKKSLEELNTKLEKFESKGVKVLALSMDDETRAKKSKQDWDMDGLALGYGLSAKEARSWGLYLSKSIKDGEPDTFSEPGMFLVKPDQSVYCASIQSMPFARPALDDLLGASDFILSKDYPPRGRIKPEG